MTDFQWARETKALGDEAAQLIYTGELTMGDVRRFEKMQRRAENDGQFDAAEYIGHCLDDMRDSLEG